MSSGRVLALDVGSVRIGVAVSDPGRRIAQPLGVWPARDWRERLEAALQRYDPALVLVGLPLRTDGSMGPEARRVAELMESLRAAHPEREFRAWDERFTTVIAQQALLEADVSRKGRRERVDKVAAALILQSWLDSEQS